jgi:hypothetical protein
MSNISHSYFVVMIDLGKLGLEAIVQPEITEREVISRIKSGEYRDIVFIHHIEDGLVEDVTSELIDAAELTLKEEHRRARVA